MTHKVFFERRYVEFADDDSYLSFCGLFNEVNAAGGLVKNGLGQCMMIFRNGLWDLPKGHQEQGESIEQCALREVSEETGLSGLKLGKLIAVTDHVYLRGGKWFLKHTWWYSMTCNGDSEPVPQREEGISEACWISADQLEKCLENCYSSILELFR